MITLRRIQRLWDAKSYERMLSLLMEMRAEASLRASTELARAIPVAAMTIIRLDELNQFHAPLCGHMIRVILAAQEADGGWREAMTTALCLRALMCCHGEGLAIDRGLEYLASLQRAEGLWPREPLRQMPADPYVSAFVLYELAEDDRFAQAVRLGDALAWFEAHEASLDPEAARLWKRLALRHRALHQPSRLAPLESVWS